MKLKISCFFEALDADEPRGVSLRVVEPNEPFLQDYLDWPIYRCRLASRIPDHGCSGDTLSLELLLDGKGFIRLLIEPGKPNQLNPTYPLTMTIFATKPRYPPALVSIKAYWKPHHIKSLRHLLMMLSLMGADEVYTNDSGESRSWLAAILQVLIEANCFHLNLQFPRLNWTKYNRKSRVFEPEGYAKGLIRLSCERAKSFCQHQYGRACHDTIFYEIPDVFMNKFRTGQELAILLAEHLSKAGNVLELEANRCANKVILQPTPNSLDLCSMIMEGQDRIRFGTIESETVGSINRTGLHYERSKKRRREPPLDAGNLVSSYVLENNLTPAQSPCHQIEIVIPLHSLDSESPGLYNMMKGGQDHLDVIESGMTESINKTGLHGEISNKQGFEYSLDEEKLASPDFCENKLTPAQEPFHQIKLEVTLNSSELLDNMILPGQDLHALENERTVNSASHSVLQNMPIPDQAILDQIASEPPLESLDLGPIFVL